MKKIATYFSLIAIVMAASTLLSCSKNNSDPDPEPPTPVAQKADVQYGIPDLHDLHALANVSVTYVDAAGKSVTENVTATPWAKEVKGITPPFTAKMTIKITRKAGIAYDRERYDIGSGYYLAHKKDSDVSYLDGNIKQFSTSTPVVVAKIEAFLIRLEEKDDTRTHNVPIL